MEVPIWASDKKDDPGIDMSFTEEQIAFRDTVRKMVAKHVAPVAAEIDETDRFPLELVKLFGEMGLMQLWVPERYGGPNGNLTMVCLAREEIARSPACLIAGLNSMFIMPLFTSAPRNNARNTCRSSPRVAS
jgi:alkylation response protein AidB-like acyl-CoA dehydrogenase